jgi:hypothetical protein
MQYLATAWVALSVILGLGAFGAIYFGGGGFATAPAPTAQPTTALPVAPVFTLAPSPTPEPGLALPPLTSFMLGGQAIHGGIPSSDKMHEARMTWVKLQAQDLSVDFGPAIENAHELGFRILISVVDKSDNKFKITSPDYQQTFADYLVTLAGQGADAIEVWNEENIEREWPSGQISGQSYAQLLQFVYPQIKAANSNTIVISGAPSPTGFFGGGCTPQGCDDKPFIEAMAAAGAFNYADCIGIHYNEGLISPSRSSGDPRDFSEHYTRYYQTMVDTYWNASGGTKPLCFTEIGYLSGEEWGYLPDNFLWKPPINLTVAEHAQYLAEAARLSRDQGKVRLMIVFNVDFTVYPEAGVSPGDPQAGYAILRLDGSCPACETLKAVMATP